MKRLTYLGVKRGRGREKVRRRNCIKKRKKGHPLSPTTWLGGEVKMETSEQKKGKEYLKLPSGLKKGARRQKGTKKKE